MFVPVPWLVAIAIVILALLVVAVKRRSGARDLMVPPETRSFRPSRPYVAGAPLSPDVEAEVRALIASGRKIEAVKLVRETIGLGLKESLDLVESL